MRPSTVSRNFSLPSCSCRWVQRVQAPRKYPSGRRYNGRLSSRNAKQISSAHLQTSVGARLSFLAPMAAPLVLNVYESRVDKEKSVWM